MPKIIAGLRERILTTARDVLLEGGYGALTIRGVAKACGVAVGTVYNYFPAKDMLAASVILADWIKALERMRLAVDNAQTVEQGLNSIYYTLMAFSDTYSPAWASYHAAEGSWAVVQERHGLLISQLVEQLTALCARFSLAPDAMCLSVAAETLLARSRQRQDFDALAPALKKLLS